MKQKISYISAFVVIVAAFCGCSSMQQVIKSGNAELMYDHALLYYEAEKWTKSITLLETCESAFRGTIKEDSVAFFKARSYFKNMDYSMSSTLFDEFRRSFGRSAFIEDAEAMYAISLYNMCPPPERDQTMTSQAIIAISEFMSHYPNSEQLHLFSEMTKELTWRMHEKEFVNAYTYFKIERYNSAIVAFRNALKKYPDSHRREDLMYHIVMSSFLLAENSIETKQLDRYLSTLDSYMTFIMEFPESKYKDELERVAETTRRFIDKNQKEE
ncbi:MAG: outer membrane protein assembly factor BamD [Alistipes sp.]|nr:outer membrane protein assembly factor BamD [Alistipes sp.]MBQ6582023.1 outer membrane protein assembly factor BamD [Alistipes sp.]